MSDKKPGTSVQIIVAIIGATAVLIAALISLLQPIVDHWADNKFPTNTPLVSTSEATQPSTQTVVPENIVTAVPTITATVSPNTDVIAGNWTGTVVDDGTNYRLQAEIFIEKTCEINEICGTIHLPDIPCTGKLELIQIKNDVFVFAERDVTGETTCVSSGQDTLELLSDGTISRKFISADKSVTSYGILKRP